MYEVIICTISSGRVQRKRFDNWDDAWNCSDKWLAKNKKSRTYAVSVERVEQPVKVKTTGRSIGA